MSNSREIQGTVFKNSSVVLLSRIVDEDGLPITQSAISSISYSIYQVDESDPDSLSPVAGHSGVPVAVANTVFDTLQQDDLWDVDNEGFNFRHVLNVSAYQAFPIAGVHYQVRFQLTPTAGQIIVARFKLKAI